MKPPESKVHPHVATPDPDVPVDQHGHPFCSTCHLAIVDGDPRHTLPVVPEQREHRRRIGDAE